jgi:hypothetical protein
MKRQRQSQRGAGEPWRRGANARTPWPWGELAKVAKQTALAPTGGEGPKGLTGAARLRAALPATRSPRKKPLNRRITAAGCWLLAAGCWQLVAGNWALGRAAHSSEPRAPGEALGTGEER